MNVYKCDVTYKTLSPEPRQTLSGSDTSSQHLKFIVNHKPWLPGGLSDLESSRDSGILKSALNQKYNVLIPILICIDNDIQRHYPLCPLYSYVTVSWDTWNVLGHRVYTYIFFGHTFSIRTQVWWEMLRRDKKPLGQGGFTILAPELATESTWGVSGVCVNMGNTYEGVTSLEGGQ